MVTHLVAIIFVAGVTIAMSAVSLAIGILRDEKASELRIPRGGSDRPEGRSHLNY
jgi:hypothetical protein